MVAADRSGKKDSGRGVVGEEGFGRGLVSNGEEFSGKKILNGVAERP